MPLSDEQERIEHELRVDQMTVNIEKMRKEMAYESRKFTVQIVLAIAASLAAGVALANWVNSRTPTPAPAASAPAASAPLQQ